MLNPFMRSWSEFFNTGSKNLDCLLNQFIDKKPGSYDVNRHGYWQKHEFDKTKDEKMMVKERLISMAGMVGKSEVVSKQLKIES